jgi:cellobiose phosphorylase
MAVTQYLLGVQPTQGGLRVNPCIPAGWDGFEVRRRFRGKWITIRIENPQHVSRGVRSLTLNGATVDGNILPADLLGETNTVTAVLG